MLKKILLTCMLWVIPHIVQAQPPPTSGGQLLQIPPPPSLPSVEPQISIQRSPLLPVERKDSPTFTVQSLSISGSTVFSEADLLTVSGFKPGADFTFEGLQALAMRITQHYRGEGYLLASAYLPAQEIRGGVVLISVLEGQYGKVILRNSARFNPKVADRILEGLNSGDVVSQGPLESRLLLLSDLPGVQIKSTLAPGEQTGTADLIVDVEPDASISGSVDADNAGNRFTGENRIGASVNLNNPAGQGDVASLRALTSGEGLNYLRGAYQIPVGRATVGVAYSVLDYQLGREFEALDAHGDAQITTLFGSYPLIRSRQANAYIGLALDNKEFRDVVGATNSVTEKESQVLTGSVYGDFQDTFAGGGANSYSVALSVGELDILSPDAQSNDSENAKTEGQFSKVEFRTTRSQFISESVSLLASFRGQRASKNLDVSEKMQLGGMYGVRAYPEGEAYADQGHLLTLELRKLLPVYAWISGRFQLAAFVDTGTVQLDKNPFMPVSNRRTLSGAGVGIYWIKSDEFTATLFYARKLGNAVAESAPDRSGRIWIQVVVFF
jgi:hemolysin activation/secretion protein